MQAVVVRRGARTIELADRPEPRLEEPDGILIEPVEVGLCGTDREIARFEHGRPPEGRDEFVLGHECLARVVEVGRSIRDLAPGALVVPMVRLPCPHATCAPCRRGRQDFCTTGDYREHGIQGADGFLAPRATIESRWAVPVPDSLRELGVLVEPLSIAMKALAQVDAVQQRLPTACRHDAAGACHRALVLGAGPIGLLGALALRARGYDTWVYSRNPPRSPPAILAGSIGGRYLSSREVEPEALDRATGGIDLVFEATGAAGISFEVLPQLGANGVYVFTGIPGRRGHVRVDGERIMETLVLRNQVVVGTVNADRSAYEAAVRDLSLFAARWPGAVRSLVTARIALEEVPDRLRAEKQGIKDVVAIGGR